LLATDHNKTEIPEFVWPKIKTHVLWQRV
jgi:hypothetical protein